MPLPDDFLQRALLYAVTRWCWDDASFIEEQYAFLAETNLTPEAWIDEMAAKYDLLDPKDFLH